MTQRSLSILLLLAALGACTHSRPRDAMRGSISLDVPLYSHNDYQRARPLDEALETRMLGVEADIYVEGETLLLGHSRGELRAGFELTEHYLAPLAARVARLGSVYGDGATFTLNIEFKEESERGYQLLREILAEYAAMLSTVEAGRKKAGAVEVILVGWQPNLESLRAEQVRYVSVQRHAGSLHDDEQTQPAHLISLISAPYASTLRWNGIGTAPTRFRLALDQLVKDAHAVEGRRLRIYHVPRRASIYRQLAAAGVDLISTQAPAASLRTLENQ